MSKPRVKAIWECKMMKSRLILLLFALNLHLKTSGAQSLETIDFRMWVDCFPLFHRKFCFLLAPANLCVAFQSSTTGEKDWRRTVERWRCNNKARRSSGGSEKSVWLFRACFVGFVRANVVCEKGTQWRHACIWAKRRWMNEPCVMVFVNECVELK